MSNVEDLNPEMQECIDKFQNAVFGEEVRNALVKAIELCYQDVISYVLTNVVKGDNGKSAYELAQDNGYDGSLEDWLLSLRGDVGPQGPQGPPGEIDADSFTIDGTLDANSSNPVQNKVIVSALNNKLNKNITSPTDVNKIVTVNANGSIKASTCKIGGETFQNTDDLKKRTVSTEYGVKQYAYSKNKSDEKVFEFIDQAFSLDNENNENTNFDLTVGQQLFVERVNDESYTDSGTRKYIYYLTFIDSNDEKHRIINITELFESKQWKLQLVDYLPHNADETKYYPSVNCMRSYVGSLVSRYVDTFDFEDLEERHNSLDTELHSNYYTKEEIDEMLQNLTNGNSQ